MVIASILCVPASAYLRTITSTKLLIKLSASFLSHRASRTARTGNNSRESRRELQ
jgi:hypothetical protein